MIHAYGWRGGCPATGVTDAGVESDDWLGITRDMLAGSMLTPHFELDYKFLGLLMNLCIQGFTDC